jgi:hypothetical protein
VIAPESTRESAVARWKLRHAALAKTCPAPLHISRRRAVRRAAGGVFRQFTGGVAGYGTGALMPLVLVPIVGAEPVVPIIAISAMFTNTARALAFRRVLDGAAP